MTTETMTPLRRFFQCEAVFSMDGRKGAEFVPSEREPWGVGRKRKDSHGRVPHYSGAQNATRSRRRVLRGIDTARPSIVISSKFRRTFMRVPFIVGAAGALALAAALSCGP